MWDVKYEMFSIIFLFLEENQRLYCELTFGYAINRTMIWSNISIEAHFTKIAGVDRIEYGFCEQQQMVNMSVWSNFSEHKVSILLGIIGTHR